jgi:molybdenum cofactor cytidylyltransferase
MAAERAPIGAVILAGGLSRRMGRAKALCSWGGSLFAERIVSAYRTAAIPRLLLVTHGEIARDPLFPSLGLEDSECLVLDQPAPTPLQTLWKALEKIEGLWSAFFLHPVDHPFVLPSTLQAMTRAFEQKEALIVQPRFEDRGGHPVLIRISLAREIRGASPKEGLRQVVRRDRARVLRLEVNDPGILRGINRPGDLEGAPPP